MRSVHHRYTWNEYVSLSLSSNVKLEFFEGEIFAMAGGSPEHSAMAMAVGVQLGTQLEGKPCRAYNSDLRIRVASTGLGTFPDVSVVCGQLERDSEDANTVINPTVLVEVLSPSTEEYDRGAKFDNFRRIASLKELVLVSYREKLVEVFRRNDQGQWARFEARSKAVVRLESIDCVLDVDRIYSGIALKN
ncbi:MAG: Uma2 family endonuclease [Myxococcaceae bacterium]